MDEARLIRFVAGPDGVVVPDLARKLPGRGLWVAADRAAVETAAQQGRCFARAAKAKLSAPPDLADQVERLLTAPASGRASALRGGPAILPSGSRRCSAAIAAGKAAWLIEASDGAADGRRKLLGRRPDAAPLRRRFLGVFTSDELGLALGAENVIHTAFLAGRGADRWTIGCRAAVGLPSAPSLRVGARSLPAGGTVRPFRRLWRMDMRAAPLSRGSE